MSSKALAYSRQVSTRVAISLTVLLLLGSIGAGVAQAKSPAGWRKCGELLGGAAPFPVAAKRVSCAGARKFARRWLSYHQTLRSNRYRGYRCKTRVLGIELATTTCTKSGGRGIWLEWGS